MGIHVPPLVAWLTDAMVLPAGEPVPQSRLIHHVLSQRSCSSWASGSRGGPELAARPQWRPWKRFGGGAEVIDSRYRNFQFQASDVVADNASSGVYITGPPVGRAPKEMDLYLEEVLVEADGRVVDSATGAAVQGHPGEALAFAANELGRRGHAIEAGWVVLTGGG